MTRAPQPPFKVQFLDAQGFVSPPWREFLLGEFGGLHDTITNVNSGAAQTAARIAAETAARIANDAALAAGVSGGSGSASNGAAFSGAVTSGATWIVASTVTVTPGGAGGDYTITVTPDVFFGGTFSAGSTFSGEWRLIEELTSGGTEYTLASGTFECQFTPGGEGEFVLISESYEVGFVDLPTGVIAANNSAQSDIRFEIRRASGTNNITAPGLSGGMTVSWTA